MTDYEDLAFKPKMTWEELKEFAKKYKKCIIHPDGTMFKIKNLYFGDDGGIETPNYVLAKNRSPEQMKTIIENLYGV